MDNQEFEMADLFSAMAELAKRGLRTLIPVFAAIFILGLAIDYYLGDTLWGSFIIVIGQFAIGYFFAKELARDAGMIGESEHGAGFGQYFGASFLMSIGIILGFMLLILPGIYLQLRWTLAIPVLFSRTESDNWGAAINRSWELTSAVVLKLAAAWLIGMLLTALSFYAYWTWAFTDVGEPRLVGLAVANAATAASVIYFLVMGFAAFLLLRTDKDELQKVFA